MSVVMVVIASLLVAVGWVLSLAGISGTWIVLVAGVGLDVAFDWSWDFVVTSIIFLLLCVTAEVVEFISGLLGAKAFGGSRGAQVGAFIGTIGGGLAGSAVIPIIGTIIGVVVGSLVGALLGELHYQRRLTESKSTGDDVKQGLKAGLGAMIAKVFAIAVKASLATIMVAWFVWIVIDGL